MAIVIQDKRSGGGLGGLILVAFIIIVVAAAAWYLFFAPRPAFDVIIPAALQKTQTIATFDIDPSSVFDSPQFKVLKKPIIQNGGGTFGRENPFIAP
jgi:uncharacterized protein involved in outer membrane biogenesis